jgi:hypothetical protein
MNVPVAVLETMGRLPGAAAADDERKHRQKALLAFMILLTLTLTVGWTLLHAWLGAQRVAFCLVLYFLVNAAAFAGLLKSQSFAPWMWLHVGSFFVLPWAATWMEGGYDAAGFICVWSAIPILELAVYRPLGRAGALLLLHAGVAVLIAYAQHRGLIAPAIFDLVDSGYPSTLSESGRLALYVTNVAGTAMAALFFFLLAQAPYPPSNPE